MMHVEQIQNIVGKVSIAIEMNNAGQQSSPV
jgi:hypothetical protein